MKKIFSLQALFVALFSIMLAYNACAFDPVTDELKERLASVERELLRVKKKVSPEAKRQSQISTSHLKSTRVEGDITGNIATDFEIRISALQEDVQRMTGQFERSNHYMEQVQGKLEKLNDDLEFRLAELEMRAAQLEKWQIENRPENHAGNSAEILDAPVQVADAGMGARSPAPMPKAVPVPVPQRQMQKAEVPKAASVPERVFVDDRKLQFDNPESGQPIIVKELPLANAKPKGLIPTPINPSAKMTQKSKASDTAENIALLAQAMDDPQANVVGSSTEIKADVVELSDGESFVAPQSKPLDSVQASYDQAFAYLREPNYVEAEKGFQAFLSLYPEDKLSPNAQYWLAETYYARGKFTEAIAAFADGYKKHPQHAKAMDNLMKLGLSFAAINRKDEACMSFAQFEKKYPKAPVSVLKRIRSEASKMGCGQ